MLLIKARKLKMNNKGFSLVVVLILSLVISLMGGTAMYIAATNFKTTAADLKFNVADKASNAGLLSAFDEINKRGAGGADTKITGNLGNASYSANIMFGGKNLWFISSEGSIGNPKIASVVKTALFQGYYGVGLYTVRGTVSGDINDGPRLSGCDATPDPDCFVPAFIASGPINVGTTKACNATGAADGTTSGVFGSPAILKLDQGDLSRIFFKVGCFNKYIEPPATTTCTTSLLDYLEYDYGNQSIDFSFQQTGASANGYGIPVVSIPPLPAFPASPPNVGSGCILSNNSLNLSSQLTTCSEIVFNSTLADVAIHGARSGAPAVKIYTRGINNRATFAGASNFTFYTTGSSQAVNVSNSSNFTIYSTNTGTFSNNSDFNLYTTGTTTLNNTNSNFRLNTTGETIIDNSSIPSGKIYTIGAATLIGSVSGTAEYPFRIVSTNTIKAEAGASLTHGNLIAGPAAVNETNSVTALQNFVAKDNITVDNVNIIARSLRFNNNSTVRILDSLVYVYAYACPNCSRAANTSSSDACKAAPYGTGDNRWCGWYGDSISLNIGRASDGTAKPVLFISNNTTVHTVKPSSTVYIWGVWYGEDVTYLAWNGNNISQNISGFLIRNFPIDPPGLTLDIKISGSGFTMNFSKNMIDQVTKKYRFFREVECVRDPLTPKAQLLQTRMTNY